MYVHTYMVQIGFLRTSAKNCLLKVSTKLFFSKENDHKFKLKFKVH